MPSSRVRLFRSVQGRFAAVFLLSTAIFGVASVFLTPPLQVPDEHTHFYRAYDVSRGHLIARAPVMLPKTVTALQAQYPPRLEVAWAEYRKLTRSDLLHSLHEDLRPDDTVGIPSGHIYTFVPYLPSAFGIFLARHLGTSALGLLYAGRLFNLLAYLCLIAWALLKLPGLHLPFLLIATMPMSIQQAASLSADSFTIAVTLLYLAVILSEALADPQPLGSRQYALLLVLAIVVVMAKANVALVFLPVLIPAPRFGGFKRKVVFVAAYAIAAYLPFALWQYLNRDNLEAFRAASLQTGVDIPANIAFVNAHPIAFLRVLARTLHDRWVDYITSLVGLVGWNAARLPRWIVALYFAVIAVASVSEKRDPWLSTKQRLMVAVIVIASLLSVFIALWTLETQQHAMQTTIINNVQGRYFITILALAAVVISVRMKWPVIHRLSALLTIATIVTANVAFGMAAWQAYYATPPGSGLKQAPTLAKLSNAGIFWGGFYLLQSDPVYREGCQSFHFLNGRIDAVPLVGDWNGDGRAKPGMYRDGYFYLDGKEISFTPPQPGDVPIVGDWNGDGRTKIGIFRSGFLWILDYNGNGKLDPVSPDGDRVFGLGGIPMDLPVVGDWTGDGRSKAGIYRHGVWLLQSEDTLTSTVKYATQRFGFDLIEEGRDCDIPVVGDWNGDRKSRVGMLLVRNLGPDARTYEWVLDRNGSTTFGTFHLGGPPGDVPLVWNLGRGRPSTVGVYRNGTWMIPGDRPGSTSMSNFGGNAHDIVVPGDWNGDGSSKPGVLRGGYWVLYGR